MLHIFGSTWMRGGRGLQIWNKKLMPESEYEEHVAKVRAAMKKQKIDVLLLSEYLTYFRARAVLILPKTGPLVVA